MLEDWEEFTLSIQMTKSTKKFSKMRGENWKDLWLQPCRAKDNRASRKWLRSQNLDARRVPKQCVLYGGISWIHEATSGIFAVQKSWRSHCRQRILLRCLITIWCTSFFLMPQAMKIPDAKGRSGQIMEKLETIPAWNLEKVKSKKEVVLEAQRDKKKVHFATLMDICHLKNAELEHHIAEVPRQSRAPERHCKRRLWSLCSFYWTGLVCVPDDCCKNNGCCCKITRLWRTSSWCSICLYSGKIGGCSQIAQNS